MSHSHKLKTMLLMLLLSVTAQAQIADGKVYNFVNVAKGTSMTCTSQNGAAVATTDVTNYSQLWYAESSGDGFTLRNLANGLYLYSPNATSNGWTLKETNTDANNVFSATAVDSYYAVRVTTNTGSYNYMHADGSDNIVCWESSSTASQWTINEVTTISSDDLTANWNRLTEMANAANNKATYQEALSALFTDYSCSELNFTYSSYTKSQMESDANYEKLPATLQAMVLKMCTDGTWAEDNYDDDLASWDADYAQKYRVQLYEPYNEPEAAASALNLAAHTNLNNPTGIFANLQDILYVMVEGEIEDGADLYLASYTGNGKPGGYASGTKLEQGLNVVPVYVNGSNFCINYVVHTFDTSNGKGNLAKKRKLSDYDDLKIHIEGGYINGYYNKMGDGLYTPDNSTTWEYLEERATQTTVTVLGKYMTLQFPLKDADTGGNKGLASYFNESVKVEAVIDEWDNVMMWERLVMGVLDEATIDTASARMKSPYSKTTSQHIYEYTGYDTDGYGSDYSDYYNVHGLALGVNHGYMYGAWDHSGYHFNTMSSIIAELPYGSGVHWGPGHEIGHQHQYPLNMRGLTETTNNLFSNVVLWSFGESTSRYNGSDGALDVVLNNYNEEGTDFFSMNVWAQTQMYYKLFLYYHVLGNNPKFYPRLFEMLRQDPMTIEYNQDGAECLLHFYKKCCYAAEEDLTEFFRAHGFLEVMTDRFVGDYSNAVYNMTQTQIDEAIAEIRGKSYPENISVLFINDATGEAILSHKGDTLDLYQSASLADVGSYASFTEASTEASDYTYIVTGNTVTMTGTGGVGFVIRNAAGEIIAFSDQATFEISTETAELIASGEATFEVTNSDNTTSEPVDVMASDDTSAKYAALGELLEAAQVFVDFSDGSGTKFGFYREDAIADLITAYNKAKTVYDAKIATSYSAVYDVLSREYLDVMGNEYARIGLVEGNAYRLENKLYTTRSLSVPTDSTNNQLMGEITDTESSYDQQLWYFENSGTDGSYYLKNKNTVTYLGDFSGNRVYATASTTSDAAAYKLQDMGSGLWALVGSQALHLGGSSDYKYALVGWSADSDASQWYITSVESNQTAEALYNLQALIAKTEDLIGDMADVVPEHKLVLQDSFPTQPNYLSTNADHNAITGESDGQGLNGLLDDATDTYFHSEYRNNVTSTHYLQVDLGSGNEMKAFKFNYTTRNNGNNCPTAIKVEGSADGSSFTEIETFDSDLPTGSAESWESTLLDGTGYRYLRFSVTATENSMRYFVMSSFGVTDMTASVKSITDIYATGGLTEETIVNAYAVIHEDEEVIAAGEATQSELESLYSTLEGSYYQPLLTIYQNAQETALAAAQAELLSWINTTQTLLYECGGVTYTEAVADTEITGLQTTNESGDYYVWTNAQSTAEGPISGLVDGYYGSSYTTSQYYFHTAYNSETITDDWAHHFTINLGESNAVSAFKFMYRNRTDAGAGFPSKIVVWGSTDGDTYSELIALTDMEATATEVYTSPIIEGREKYTHLRFVVTSNKSYFHMAEFDLYVGTPSGYNVGTYSGDGKVTDSLMIATALEYGDAQAIYDNATNIELIERETMKLQAAYQALYDAHNNITYVEDKSGLQTLITETQALLDACYNSGDDTYTGSLYLTEELNTTTAAEIDAARAVYTQSKVTEKEYDETLAALQTAYNNLAAAQTSADKENGLQALIDETSALLDICGTISYGEYPTDTTKVELQANSSDADYWVSSNADQNTGGGTTDGGGIAALVDGSESTYFHTRWGGTVVNEPHYIQVDMGNGLTIQDFLFSYKPRSGSPAPKAITICGSNDGTTFTDTLATITKKLPDHNDGLAYTSSIIRANTAYRYLRFTVTNSAGPGNAQYGGYYFFGMLEFSLNSVTYGTGYHVESLDPNAGSVTKELVMATYTEKVAAEVLLATATTDDALTTATSKLKAQNDALKLAYDTKILPVIVTTDPEEPVLYTLNLPYRDAKKRLQYEPASSHMISVADSVQGSAKQAFYFMPGDERTQVYILPYAAGEQVLAASNKDDGSGKVSAAENGELKYEQWQFVSLGDTCYNIQPVGTSTYFSNYGGTGNKMGFYGSNNTTDDGSRFTFTRTAVEGTGAYNSLKIYYDEAAKVASSSITGGSTPGYYPEAEAYAYNEAYAEATPLHDNAVDSATYDVYLDAYKKLLIANEALEIIMPEVGKYYRFVSVVQGDGSNTFVYANPADNKMYWSADKGERDATAIWTFVSSATDGKYNVCNFHTGSNINGFIYYNPSPLSETAGDVTIKSLSLDGQVGFMCNGRMMHAQGGGAVVHWETDANDASAWRIVEVEDMSLVNFALEIGVYRHAGLYLNYSATIPEGVEVFIAHTPDGAEEGDATILADKIEGTVLPAHTAVIVKGDANTYDFKYTTSAYDGSDDLTVNKLGGSAYLKYQRVAKEGNRCCVFGVKDDEVGLYKNYVEYADSLASQSVTTINGTDTTTTSYVDTDNGTHFRVSANKIYYEYEPATVSGASSFRFRFNSNSENGGETTPLDQLLMITDDLIIYNLYGQRLTEVTEPGIYIINGKKTYVSEKMIRGNN